MDGRSGTIAATLGSRQTAGGAPENRGCGRCRGNCCRRLCPCRNNSGAADARIEAMLAWAPLVLGVIACCLTYVEARPALVTRPTSSKPAAFVDAIRVSQNQPQGLSDAAVASLIVQQSRNAYYATGHPCACPDDLMRNGRRCGGSSAYIRPGGAQPLCSVADVSPEMINRYRARLTR